jgi:hypothetical protein
MLLIMHHIALCISSIALFNCDHLLHIRVDHVEPESELQAKQVRRVFKGPQASSDENTNLALDQGKPRCIYPMPLSFILKVLLYALFDCALSL